MKNQAEKTTQKITWIGMCINILLSGIKLMAGIFGSSQALIADAIHSLSDITTDIAILVGVKFWSAPPDDNHPYGHGKIETIVTSFIGVALAAAAIGIGYGALITIKDKPLEQPGSIALVGALLSILLKEVVYRWTASVGKKLKSTALIANAWHHRTDAMSSIPVACAVIITMIFPEWSFVDHIGAFVVSLFILHAAYTISKPAMLELTDGGNLKVLQKKIQAAVKEVKGVKSVHAIRVRTSGPGILTDLHIIVDPEIPVREGHSISEKVKEHLYSKEMNIIDVVIHIEPY